jgi:drug/metabolite transporter (DMT)-like permease
MSMSALLYSVQNSVIKLQSLRGSNAFFSLTFYRSLIGTILSILLSKGDIVPPSGSLKYLSLRGLIGGLTITTGFYAVAHCNLVHVTVIMSSSTLVTGAFNRLFLLKVDLTLLDIILCFACIGGVLLMTLGDHKKQVGNGLGIVLAVVSILCQSGVNTLISVCRNKECTTGVITFYGFVGGLVVSLPGFLYEHFYNFKETSLLYYGTTYELFSLVVLVGLLSFFGQTFKTFAINQCSGWHVLMFRYLEIPFSILWSFVLFHQPVNLKTLLGCAIVLISCILCLISKSTVSKEDIILPITVHQFSTKQLESDSHVLVHTCQNRSP